MRKCNLISLIYANLEKTSAAIEEAAQTNASGADARLPLRPVGTSHHRSPRSTVQTTNGELLSFTGKIKNRIPNGICCRCDARDVT
jgi:hypothetical protein